MQEDKLFDPFETVKNTLKDDKAELLESMQTVFDPVEGISFKNLVTAALIFLVVLAIIYPKIYLRNAIYYESRDVAKLEHEYEILKQEQELLKVNVEKIRYKNQVEDTLF